MLAVWRSERVDRWLRTLRDTTARTRILLAIDAMTLRGEPVGDWKRVAGISGLFELRVHVGPGCRLFFAFEGTSVLLLLVGGDKSTQLRDIKQAKAILRDWREHHGR